MLAMFVSGVVVMIGRMFSTIAVTDSVIHTVDGQLRYLTQICIIQYGTAFFHA
jgi:hypothetical protein